MFRDLIYIIIIVKTKINPIDKYFSLIYINEKWLNPYSDKIRFKKVVSGIANLYFNNYFICKVMIKILIDKNDIIIIDWDILFLFYI